MEWRRFEELVAEYFRQRGDVAILNEFGADGGIDVQVRVKATGGLIAFQCKSWRNLVRVKVVRELFGALKLAGIDDGEIFSRSGFSSDALIEAEKL